MHAVLLCMLCMTLGTAPHLAAGDCVRRQRWRQQHVCWQAPHTLSPQKMQARLPPHTLQPVMVQSSRVTRAESMAITPSSAHSVIVQLHGAQAWVRVGRWRAGPRDGVPWVAGPGCAGRAGPLRGCSQPSIQLSWERAATENCVPAQPCAPHCLELSTLAPGSTARRPSARWHPAARPCNP